LFWTPKKRVRGFYDGTKKDIKRLIEDITFLSTKLEMTFNGLQFN
jgi:hypothetical protein